MSMELVLLKTEAPSLQFETPEQQKYFELGVSTAVFLWDDLATAVANNWGGPDSEEKREWLAASIIELFDANEVATEDIEFRLLAAMEDEFDVTVETDTALIVADTIIKVYQQVKEKNFDFVSGLFERYQKVEPPKAVKVEENETDDENDEEEDNSQQNDVEDSMDVDVKETNEPIIDEDGFQLVTRRR